MINLFLASVFNVFVHNFHLLHYNSFLVHILPVPHEFSFLDSFFFFLIVESGIDLILLGATLF